MLLDGITLIEGSEITNISCASGTAFPASPNNGEMFYRTDLNQFYVYENSTWSSIGTDAEISAHVTDTTLHPWLLNGSDIYRSSGNLGIGTNSPTRLGAGFKEMVLTNSSEGAAITLEDDAQNVQMSMFTSDVSGAGVLRTVTNHPLVFRTNNTERMRINSNGWVGVGGTPNGLFQITEGDGTAELRLARTAGVTTSSELGRLAFCDSATVTSCYISGFRDGGNDAGSFRFLNRDNAGTMNLNAVISANGDFCIGNATPANYANRYTLDFRGRTHGGVIDFHDNASVRLASMYSTSTGALYFFADPDNVKASSLMSFSVDNSEKIRIDSTGVCIGATNAGYSFDVNGAAASNWLARLNNSTGTNPYGMIIQFSGAAPNNTTQKFMHMQDSAATRFEMRSNGGLANYSANNVNLSDARVKTDIQDAPSYLEKLCSIPVRTYKYIDQTHDDSNLGVIAQEVEAVCPELVDVDGFGETPEDGIPLRAIYQTDMQYAMLKAMQELKAKNDALKALLVAKGVATQEEVDLL